MFKCRSWMVTPLRAGLKAMQRCDRFQSSPSPLMRSVMKRRRRERPAAMTMCRSPLAHVSYWRKLDSTCPKVDIVCYAILGLGKPMRRRDFIGLVGGAVASRPLPAFAQSPSKRPLIAAQIGGSKTVVDRFFGGFSQGMRELGYVEGGDYEFEVRYADGHVSRIPPQIEELVRMKPDILL